MSVISANHEELRQFLLGSLNKEARQRIEELLMTESDFLEELEVCEEELIDDYVNDQLDAESRVKFEQHFLCSPDRMQKLRFAVALDRYTSKFSETEVFEVEPPAKQVILTRTEPGWSGRLSVIWNAQSWAFRSAMTVAVVAVIAVIVWSMMRPDTFVAISLSSSTSERSAGSSSAMVNFPLKAKSLRITLNLSDSAVNAHDYRVELMDVKQLPTEIDVIARDAQTLTVVIPASKLDRGGYAIRLYVIKPDGTKQRINGSYYFTVQ